MEALYYWIKGCKDYTSFEKKQLKSLTKIAKNTFEKNFTSQIEPFLTNFNKKTEELQIDNSSLNFNNESFLKCEITQGVEYLKDYLTPNISKSFLKSMFYPQQAKMITKVISCFIANLLKDKIFLLKDNAITEMEYQRQMLKQLINFIREVILHEDPSFEDTFNKEGGESFFSTLKKLITALTEINSVLNKKIECVSQQDCLNEFKGEEYLKEVINFTSQYISSLVDDCPGFMLIGLFTNIDRENSQEHKFLTSTNLGKIFIDQLLTKRPTIDLFKPNSGKKETDFWIYNTGEHIDKKGYAALCSDRKVKLEINESLQLLSSLSIAANTSADIKATFQGIAGSFLLIRGPWKDSINNLFIKVTKEALEQLKDSLSIINNKACTLNDLKKDMILQKLHSTCEEAIDRSIKNYDKLFITINSTSDQRLGENLTNSLKRILGGIDSFQLAIQDVLGPGTMGKYVTAIEQCQHSFQNLELIYSPPTASRVPAIAYRPAPMLALPPIQNTPPALAILPIASRVPAIAYRPAPMLALPPIQNTPPALAILPPPPSTQNKTKKRGKIKSKAKNRDFFLWLNRKINPSQNVQVAEIREASNNSSNITPADLADPEKDAEMAINRLLQANPEAASKLIKSTTKNLPLEKMAEVLADGNSAFIQVNPEAASELIKSTTKNLPPEKRAELVTSGAIELAQTAPSAAAEAVRATTAELNKVDPEGAGEAVKSASNELLPAVQTRMHDEKTQSQRREKLLHDILTSDITQYATTISKIKEEAQNNVKDDISQKNYQLEILACQTQKGETLVIEKFRNLPLNTPLLPEAQKKLREYRLKGLAGGVVVGGLLLAGGVIGCPIAAIVATSGSWTPEVYICIVNAMAWNEYKKLPLELQTVSRLQKIKFAWLAKHGLLQKYKDSLGEESKLQTNLNNYAQGWFENVIECMHILSAALFKPQANISRSTLLKSHRKLLEDIISSDKVIYDEQFFTPLPGIDIETSDAAIELRCVFLYLLKNYLFFPKGRFITSNNEVIPIEESQERGVEGTEIPKDHRKHLSPEDERENRMIKECQKYIITYIEVALQELEKQIKEAGRTPNIQPEIPDNINAQAAEEAPLPNIPPPFVVNEANIIARGELTR